MKTVAVIAFVVLVGCNNANNSSEINGSITTKNDSVSNENGTIKNSTSNEEAAGNDEKNDSTILISFPKDSTWVTVNGKMKGMNHPVTVYIPVKQGKQLTATIIPDDSTANIRINQVFTPDGKADGPFGRELKRTLRQQGTYKLILAENLMQGDEWKGNFKLTIRVE
ncbi:hypothetical protein [Segetibacter koreensis]|uniref:hypothetical protein n=1 Tax=Segetibacter koreensis TaxID=398037 RepID=UPI00037D8B91|nr:hypothetical protein [Segetibacter koreensis]